MAVWCRGPGHGAEGMDTDAADAGAPVAAAVEDLPEGEQPLLQRVARLLPRGAAPRVALADAEKLGSGEVGKGAGGGAADAAGAAITADSLTVLLSQALCAGDDVRRCWPLGAMHPL